MPRRNFTQGKQIRDCTRARCRCRVWALGGHVKSDAFTRCACPRMKTRIRPWPIPIVAGIDDGRVPCVFFELPYLTQANRAAASEALGYGDPSVRVVVGIQLTHMWVGAEVSESSSQWLYTRCCIGNLAVGVDDEVAVGEGKWCQEIGCLCCCAIMKIPPRSNPVLVGTGDPPSRPSVRPPDPPTIRSLQEAGVPAGEIETHIAPRSRSHWTRERSGPSLMMYTPGSNCTWAIGLDGETVAVDA